MKNQLLTAARCALADLEGIMPEFEPSGDKKHPAWQTIKDLRNAIVSEEWDQQNNVSFKWSIEDVKGTASEMELAIELTDEQAMDILQLMEKNHDACIGINWEVIECTINMYVRDHEIID